MGSNAPHIMTINFKVAISEPNVVEKVTVDTVSLQGTLRNESPVSSPSILVETDSIAIGDLVRSNYAHIPEFGRYYYIRECTHFRNHLWVVDMHCDVLMSFSAGIKASSAIIEETSLPGLQNVNKYVTNDAFSRLVKDKTDIIQFPDGFDVQPYFILITAGGIVS